MRAQGLPINFIVLAALAILILILAAGFVIGGGTSIVSAVSPAAIKNTCNNACLNLQNQATAADVIWTSMPTSTYCNNYTVTGYSTKLQCSSPAIGAPCTLTFRDGTNCVVGCGGTGTPITCT